MTQTDRSRLTRKGQETRGRIVRAAAEMMYERGVAGTSTEDVQVAAGVSASQIYHYFADKKSLVRAVVAQQVENVVDPQVALLNSLDSVEALREWRDYVIKAHRKHQAMRGCPIGSLSSELAGRDPAAQSDLASGFGRWEGAIRDGIAAMRDRGELRSDADPERLAIAALAAVQGGLLLAQARTDSAPLEIALDEVIDRVRGFRADGEPAAKPSRTPESVPSGFADREEAIRLATETLLAEVGYDQLTMSDVAKRANASKATIYRHWDGKADLVESVIRAHSQTPIDMPPDPRALLRAVRDALTGQDGELVLGLVGALNREPDLASAVRRHLIDDKRNAVASALAAAGESAELLAEVFVAALLSRLVVTKEPVDDEFLDQLMDSVLSPAAGDYGG
ncbi:TetR/AcrR family transcriptional regulator [Kibdelosporangium philippinense]|uniref:TetR/AcrR family transcriptional regulator n=1 Tax=Kibdelosporangium philippinense TaxID=211113 RepID=A0ABS8Z5D4_9PSEU|nr:TetR/AcrR family transcriptional regulator [Kibdelosporangium philippinense]MCE7003104.1 TetR/AcrR family transcriptional regulator [Kibdelosporangium philippinense]